MSERLRAWFGGRPADLACLVALVLCNPVLYAFNDGILRYTSPDAIAYATLGRSLVRNGRLYVASWGHVDIGLILPPLYPLLIGLGGILSDNLLKVAAWISSVSLILTGLVCFWLIRGSTGRLVATCAALAIPLGVMFGYGFAPLTEALFLLLMAMTLCCLVACVASGRTRLAVATGLLCALTFLTRPVGLFLLAFCLSWVAFTKPVVRGERRSIDLRCPGAILGGFLMLAAPYAAALYAQTGQHPLRRTFRMGHYHVGTSDPGVLEEIRQMKESSEGNYQAIYRRRRRMRKLLPDASEMYYALVATGPGSAKGRPALGKLLRAIVDRPSLIPDRLLGNLRSLARASGPVFFYLFLITTLTPLLVRPLRNPWPRRLMLSAWIWFYLIGISLVTDLIHRYLDVMVPLLVLQVVVEATALASMAAASAVRWRRSAICVALLIGGVATYPTHPTSAALRKAYYVAPASFRPLRSKLEEGEALFALTPLDAYLLDASYRILPDDTLDKVARYAGRTGVRWLFVAHLQHDLRQIQHYSHRWYLDPRLGSASDPYLEKCCDAEEGRIVLYRFRDGAPSGEAGPH